MSMRGVTPMAKVLCASAGAAPAHARSQAHLLARNDARKAARGAREVPCLEGLLSSPRAEPGGCVGLRARGSGRGIPAGVHQDRNPAPAEGTRESALVAPRRYADAWPPIDD